MMRAACRSHGAGTEPAEATPADPKEETRKLCTLPRGWQQLKEDSGYEARVAEVAKFNAEHVWRKRGIVMTPCKWVEGRLVPLVAMCLIVVLCDVACGCADNSRVAVLLFTVAFICGAARAAEDGSSVLDESS